MHKAGKIAVITGIALIVSGMIIGFTALFLNKQSEAIQFLGIIPVGFIVTLAGIVTTQLFPESDDNS